MADTILHRYPLTILERHLDAFGHVNNAAYFEILEEARWDLITKNGFGMKQIQEAQVGPTILEAKIRFHRELRLRDEVVIESTSTGFERKVLPWTQRIVRDGLICTDVEFVVALFDLRLRKIIEPTPEWRRALGLFEDS